MEPWRHWLCDGHAKVPQELQFLAIANLIAVFSIRVDCDPESRGTSDQLLHEYGKWLFNCRYCISAYKTIKLDLLYNKYMEKDFAFLLVQAMDAWDVGFVIEHLNVSKDILDKLDSMKNVTRLEARQLFPSQTPLVIFYILSYPQILKQPGFGELFASVFIPYTEYTGMDVGTTLLSALVTFQVHPDRRFRKWAKDSLTNHVKLLTRAQFENTLAEPMYEILQILQNDLFDKCDPNFFVKSKDDYWCCIRLFVNILSNDAVKNSLCKLGEIDVRRLVCAHLSDSEPHLHEVLQTFESLLRRLKRSMWQIGDEEYAMTTLQTILDNPTFIRLVAHGQTSIKSSSDSLSTIPGSLTALNWLQPFIASVIGLQPYERTLKHFSHILFVTMQAPRYDENCRLQCMKIGLQLLLTAVEELQIHRRTLVDVIELYANEITRIAYSTEFPTPEKDQVKIIAKKLIELTLSQDTQDVIQYHQAFYVVEINNDGGEKQSASPIPGTDLTICPELWRLTLSLIPRGDMESASALMKLYMRIAYLAPKGQDSVNYDKLPSQELKGIRLAMESFLQRFSQARPDALRNLISSSGMPAVIFQFYFQASEDIRGGTQAIIEQAYDVVTRHDSLQALLNANLQSSLDGLCVVMEGFTQWTQLSRATFKESYAIVEILPDILDILCGFLDGLLFRIGSSSEDDKTRLIVPRLWRSLWLALNEMYEKSIEWSSTSKKSNDIFKVFMFNVLDTSEILMKYFGIFEMAAKGQEYGDDKLKISIIGRQMIDYCRPSLKSVTEWLFLRVPECLQKAVNLVCSLLNAVAKAQLVLDDSIKQRLVGIASKNIKLRNNLTQEQIATLILALSAHDVDEFTDVPQPERKKEISNGPAKNQSILSWTKPMPTLSSKPKVDLKPKFKQQKTVQANSSQPLSALKSLKEEIRRERSGMQRAPVISTKSNAIDKILPDIVLCHTNFSAKGDADSDKSNSSSDENDAEDEEDANALFSIVRTQKALENIRPRQGLKRTIKVLDLPTQVGDSKVDKLNRLKAEKAARARLVPDLGSLHQKILSWDIDYEGDYPSDKLSTTYLHVADTYSSTIEYNKVFEPLFMLEVWQQIRAARQELDNEVNIKGEIVNRSKSDNFHDIYLAVSANDRRKSGLNPMDIVILESRDPSRVRLLGLVQELPRPNIDGQHVITLRSYVVDTSILQFMSPKSTWMCSRLLSLIPIHREYSALKGLPYFDLCPNVLSAKAEPLPQLRPSEVESARYAYSVNAPQATAILGSMQSYGISLIQGPPGTGKTKTILGMIGHFLNTRKKASIEFSRPGSEKKLIGGPSQAKILVCAPSNAAIDEIVVRLKQGVYTNGVKSLTKVNVIRIGNLEVMNAAIKDVSLDELVETELSSMNGSDSREKNMENKTNIISLRQEISHLSENANMNRQQLEKLAPDDKTRVTIESEISKIKQTQRELGKKLDLAKQKQSEQTKAFDESLRQARSRILQRADVICSTLNGTGHDVLAGIAEGFETVIIDEAAQSVEISSLIPLKYGCKRCVLIGDPNQLPPTVLSQSAAQYGYNQSLFVRMQSMSPESVHLLSIQYRMHPEIALFPSRTFYDSKLLNGEGMYEKTKRSWHESDLFGPFRFFNISSGCEERYAGRSFFNMAEIEATISIYKILKRNFRNVNFDSKIGIITPYKQQLSRMKQRFRSEFGQQILSIVDFNTVDGFQGQEKDLIIVSTVRGGVDSGIGFLSDTRRMNVALTRARSSLFILGNADALIRNKHWRSLIETARDREFFTQVDSDTFKLIEEPKKNFKKTSNGKQIVDLQVKSSYKPFVDSIKRKVIVIDDDEVQKPKEGKSISLNRFNELNQGNNGASRKNVINKTEMEGVKKITLEEASNAAKRAHSTAFNPKDHPMVRKKTKVQGLMNSGIYPGPSRPILNTNGRPPMVLPSVKKPPSLFIPKTGSKR